MTQHQALRSAPYLSFATFRKTGTPVPTPVWAAPDSGALYIFSAGNAGKIKRLRNSNKAKLAECDMRGKLTGDWVEATAEIINDAESIERALAALRKKYGWKMWVADIGSKFTGKFNKRAYIRVQLNS